MLGKDKKGNQKGRIVPLACNVIGTLLVLLVFALALPLSVPRFLGYEIYDVVSGSMEPAIPTGSVIYVRKVEPAEVQVDEIIAFYDRGSVVAHRVVINRSSLGEFVTKGDANNTEDLAPIPYANLIGVVALHVPYVGEVMALYASNVGKIYLVLTLACGIMLNVLADQLRRQRSLRIRRELEAQRIANGEADAELLAAGREADRASRSSMGAWIRGVLAGVLALVFIGSSGVVLFVWHQYSVSAEKYSMASASYTAKVTDPIYAPITVDFDELCKVNEDVVGWLYCEDTVIDYPVMHGETNDEYLRHDYTGEYNVNGSLFVAADNAPGFTDPNNIIYGHHMSTGTMFATLEDWGDQAYYEEHPVMWLLTPERDYQVVLVSGHHIDAYDEMYDITHTRDAAFNRMLSRALEMSDFTPAEGVTATKQDTYIMLSTCAYIFDGARYTLHGKLVPVDSAGGVPLR